jgi:type I restriction enzyme M protein
MMKFAQESGKSKGQFYTPSEVSRIIARLIGIGSIKNDVNKKWTLYEIKTPYLIQFKVA